MRNTNRARDKMGRRTHVRRWMQPAIIFLCPRSTTGSELFCGIDWLDAFENCHHPCPSGSDRDCVTPGHACFDYTGCSVGGDEQGQDEDENYSDNASDGGLFGGDVCGTSFLQAASDCRVKCGSGVACPAGQICFSATGCDKPPEKISSKMLTSLTGEFPGAAVMDMSEQGYLGGSILDHLKLAMEENKMSIGSADITGQEFSEGRRHRSVMRWNDTVTGSSIGVEVAVEQHHRGRRLPSGSSALDVSMVITGEYRPPPYLDVDILIEDSINRNSETLVKEVRDRGQRGGSRFFERVDGLSALRESARTARPTNVETFAPTSSAPTFPPSMEPTRASEQMLQTGIDSDFYEDTTSSFGIIFDIKTTRNAETALIRGFSLYTKTDDTVEYEVWSKEGSWQGFEGNLDAFDKVAEGSARSLGACDASTAATCDAHFANIPFEEFEAVPILGDGGTRAFYITLKSKRDLIYAMRKTVQGKTNLGGYLVYAETPDIEVIEGASVTFYPFPDDQMFYRGPRGFLGRVWYQRNPCEDGSKTWPCQTRSPVTSFQMTTAKPSRAPVAPATSSSTSPNNVTQEVVDAGNNVTQEVPVSGNVTDTSVSGEASTPAAETDAIAPTAEVEANTPTTETDATTPGAAPIPLNTNPAVAPETADEPASQYEIKDSDISETYLVLTLNTDKTSIMDLRHQIKFTEVLVDFLQAQPTLQDATVRVINATVWHQEAKEGKKSGKKKRPRPSNASPKQNAKRARVLQKLYGSQDVQIDQVEADAVSNVYPVEITTIITTANPVLPPDVIDVLLLHIIEEDSSTLVLRLEEQYAFYSYFRDVGGVTGRIIERLTKAPTSAPNAESPEIIVEIMDDDNNGLDDNEGVSLTAYVGVGVCFLWVFLTCFSLVHIFRARSKMKRENELKKTLKSSGKTSMTSKLSDGEHSADTEPMQPLLDGVSRDKDGYFDEEEGIMENEPDVFVDNPPQKNSFVAGNQPPSDDVQQERSRLDDLIELKAMAKSKRLLVEDEVRVKKSIRESKYSESNKKFEDRLKHKLAISASMNETKKSENGATGARKEEKVPRKKSRTTGGDTKLRSSKRAKPEQKVTGASDSSESSTESSSDGKRNSRAASMRRSMNKGDAKQLSRRASSSRMVKHSDAKQLSRRASSSRMVEQSDRRQLLKGASSSRLVERGDGKQLLKRASSSRLVEQSDGHQSLKKASSSRIVDRDVGKQLSRRASSRRMVEQVDQNGNDVGDGKKDVRTRRTSLGSSNASNNYESQRPQRSIKQGNVDNKKGVRSRKHSNGKSTKDTNGKRPISRQKSRSAGNKKESLGDEGAVAAEFIFS